MEKTSKPVLLPTGAKKLETNRKKAQKELDDYSSDLFEECVDLDINNKFYFIKGKKEEYTNKLELAKRELENKYNLEKFTLIKGQWEYDDILDWKSNEVKFTETVDIKDEIDLIEKAFEIGVKLRSNLEIEKLQKKIEKAEKTLEKDKQKLIKLLQ